MFKDICPKCKKHKALTRHHIKPKRFFKSSQTIKICRHCHDDLEMIIPKRERLPIRFYYQIIRDFLRGGVYE